jgi:DnaJ-class molecular chaperone
VSSPHPSGGAVEVGEDREIICQTCQGNGEVVTDWNAYLGVDQPMSDAVAECPDCCGAGYIDCFAARILHQHPETER